MSQPNGSESCLERARVTEHARLIMYATIQFRRNTTNHINDMFQEVQIYAYKFRGHEATHSFIQHLSSSYNAIATMMVSEKAMVKHPCLDGAISINEQTNKEDN